MVKFYVPTWSIFAGPVTYIDTVMQSPPPQEVNDLLAVNVYI